MHRRFAALSLSSLLVLAACGGDDAGESAPADAPADAPAASVDEEPAESGSVGTSSAAPASATRSGTATLTMEGVTHSFIQAESGPDDDFYSLCVEVAGSLQAVLQEVDDAGNLLGGELSVVLLEPGGAYEQTGDPAELSVQLGDFRFLRAVDEDGIDAPADGSTAGGTVTLIEDIGFGDDGRRQTQEIEAKVDVSC